MNWQREGTLAVAYNRDHRHVIVTVPPGHNRPPFTHIWHVERGVEREQVEFRACMSEREALAAADAFEAAPTALDPVWADAIPD